MGKRSKLEWWDEFSEEKKTELLKKFVGDGKMIKEYLFCHAHSMSECQREHYLSALDRALVGEPVYLGISDAQAKYMLDYDTEHDKLKGSMSNRLRTLARFYPSDRAMRSMLRYAN